MMYRVIYKDGSKGAWNNNKENTERIAKEFNGTVESWDRDKELAKIMNK